MGDYLPSMSRDRCPGSKKKTLRQILGIESGDEVKELMLGMAFPAPKHSLDLPNC